MAFADAFLPEFDQEMRTTRTLLERVPMDKSEWKPHPKSTSLGNLAAHLAGLAGFGTAIVKQTGIDMAPSDGQPSRMPPAAYESQGDVYFQVGKWPDYARLSKRGASGHGWCRTMRCRFPAVFCRAGKTC